MAIWRMRVACWICKGTNTHSEYITFTAFLRQQWLRERASCYDIALLVIFCTLRRDADRNNSLRKQRAESVTCACYLTFNLCCPSPVTALPRSPHLFTFHSNQQPNQFARYQWHLSSAADILHRRIGIMLVKTGLRQQSWSIVTDESVDEPDCIHIVHFKQATTTVVGLVSSSPVTAVKLVEESRFDTVEHSATGENGGACLNHVNVADLLRQLSSAPSTLCFDLQCYGEFRKTQLLRNLLPRALGSSCVGIWYCTATAPSYITSNTNGEWPSFVLLSTLIQCLCIVDLY